MIDFSLIKPWNSKDFPVKVNNIRFNQDYTLLTLATSRGYKIFSSESLRQVQEETELVRNLGNLNIVMTYFSSNIVYFTSKKNNPDISTKELIIFDDFSQKKLSHFRSKDENIIDFYVSKNALFIALENKMLVLEILSMKIINIIENIEVNNKLISYNNYDTISYTLQKTKNKVIFEFYYFKRYKINNINRKYIKISFDKPQLIQISPSGNFIAIVSLLGNKIHIYNNGDNKLMECILIGTKVINIESLSFFNRKENYILLNLNNNKISIYKVNKDILKPEKCRCHNYSDDDIINGKIQINNNFSFFDFFSDTTNQAIKDSHLTIDFSNSIIFSEFYFKLKKCFIVIDKDGYYYMFFFMKDSENALQSYKMIKWI